MIKGFEIEGIKTDEQLVKIIDSIKHYMKAGMPYSPLRKDFNEVLDSFIVKWHLDEDPHMHARLPKKASGARLDAVNELVAKFGESHRKLIEESMRWLDKNEPEWDLLTPLDRESFIRNLLEKEARDAP